MNDAVVLSCEHLQKHYREIVGNELLVLEDVNLSVAPAEMVAIVGVSGSGKSTLLHLLGGLDHADAGTVTIMGESMLTLGEVKKARLRNRYLGFIYQFHHLLPEFNALENVCMPLLLRNRDKQAAQSEAREILSKVGLADRVEHRIAELSGGERQRVAIARALVTQPACVLADEPTGNLDEANAEVVFELMLQLSRELNTSFIVVTHNLSIAKRMDRSYRLHAGYLQIENNTEDEP